MDINLKFRTVTITLFSLMFAAAASAAGAGDFEVVSLPVKGQILSHAYAASADGSVIVGLSASDDVEEGYEAFLWQNGTITALKGLTWASN